MKIAILSRNRNLYSTRCIIEAAKSRGHEVNGIGVVLAETQKAAESVIEGFIGVKADILIQEFIKDAAGFDIRWLVVDGKVVAAIKRQGVPGEFRSNLHRGGTSSLIKITPEERRPLSVRPPFWGLTWPASIYCVPTIVRW